MKASAPKIIQLEANEVDDLQQRIAARKLTEQDYDIFAAIVAAYHFVVNLLTQKKLTIARLKKLVFGARTETTEAVLGRAAEEAASEVGRKAGRGQASADAPASDSRPKRRKGHGRLAADAYTGVERICVPHEFLEPGCDCPHCQEGKVSELPRPAMLIRLVGEAPVHGKRYEFQRLRCNLGGDVFTAQAPEDVGPKKYDVTVASTIGVLKYGTGMPFHRLQNVQANAGIPLPAGTQWEIVCGAVRDFEPAYQELICQGAQGDVLYQDDTKNRILELMGKRLAKAEAQNATLPTRSKTGGEGEDESQTVSDPQLRGIFTSGIVSTCAGRRIALFFTGRQHAGENLRDVLAQRAKQLGPPIQMCDPLALNMPADLNTILANCLAHGRRKFADAAEYFHDQCRHVLEALKVVYQNDAVARRDQLSPEARLLDAVELPGRAGPRPRHHRPTRHGHDRQLGDSSLIVSAEAEADAVPARGAKRHAIATAPRGTARRWASDMTPCSRRPTAVRLSASSASRFTPPADSGPFPLPSPLARSPVEAKCCRLRASLPRTVALPCPGNHRPPQTTILTSTSHQECPCPPSRRQG